VSALVASVEKRYSGVKTFSSDFTQTYTAKAYNQTVTSRGHVVFSRPSNAEWSYTAPDTTRVVANRSFVTMYDPSGQVFVQTVSQSQYPIALAFLDSALLSAAFTFQLFCGAQMQFPGGDVLVGTPVNATPVFDKVLLYVDSTMDVRRVLILDGLGNRDRFDFVATAVNVPISPTQFALGQGVGVAMFTVPPGIAAPVAPFVHIH
jgi:outer membrane lipoprotein-sorting protein